MLYKEITAVCSQIHTKHINTQCGQNIELLNDKLRGTYSDHCVLKGQFASGRTNICRVIPICSHTGPQ